MRSTSSTTTAASSEPGAAARRWRLTDRGLAALFLVAVVSVAAWTAARGVAPADYRGLPCPIDAALGIPCPGCGMTRACVATARGHWAIAWRLQPFAFPLLALALAWVVSPSRVRAAWRRLPIWVGVAIVWLLLGAVLLRWVLRSF